MLATSFVFPNDPHVTWSIMIVLYPYLTGLVAGSFVVSCFIMCFASRLSGRSPAWHW